MPCIVTHSLGVSDFVRVKALFFISKSNVNYTSINPSRKIKKKKKDKLRAFNWYAGLHAYIHVYRHAF